MESNYWMQKQGYILFLQNYYYLISVGLIIDPAFCNLLFLWVRHIFYTICSYANTLQVKDVMKKQNELPLCKEGDMIMDQLTELTSKGCGCLLVVDEEHHLIGTFTDGDLRRTLKASGPAIFNLTVGEMCNRFANITLLLLIVLCELFLVSMWR